MPRGEERLRITPTPGHVKEHRDHLVKALQAVWNDLGIKRTSDWTALGGFVGVGVEGAEAENSPMWSDAQLGVRENEAPEDAVVRVFKEQHQTRFPRMKTATPVRPAAIGNTPVGVVA